MTTTAIIGQGPNESSWRVGLKRHKGDVKCAEARSARLACTGKMGELLAELVGEHPLRFYRSHWRFNLNARWNGKRHGTDIFDETEAAITASTILTAHPEIQRIVCCGRNVGRIFGFTLRDPFLSINTFDRTYLLFPHPSGRNLWWNAAANRQLASRVLRQFLYGQQACYPSSGEIGDSPYSRPPADHATGSLPPPMA